MTAVNKKIPPKEGKDTYKFHRNIKKAAKGLQGLNINYPLPFIGRFVAYSRAGANFGDIPLPCLALIVMSRRTDLLEKAVMGGVTVAVFLIMSLADSRFVPYLIAVVMYIAGYTVFKGEKYPLYLSCGFLLFTKIFLTAGNLPGIYTVYACIETAAVVLLAEMVRNSRDIYKNPKSSLPISDFITLLIGGLVYTIALGGTDSGFLYTGCCVALSVSVFWFAKEDYIYGFTALFCRMAALVDKQGFTYLFMSVGAVWTVSGRLAHSGSILFYPVAVISAFVLNLCFLPRLNGFALTGTVIAALIIYIFLPNIISVDKSKKPRIFTREKDWRVLNDSMKKLENSLNYLGSCAIDISRLNEKNLVTPPLQDMVVEDVCRKCSNNTHCWQEKYTFTAGQFAKYAKNMNMADKRGFDMSFYSRCNNIDRVKASFDENSRLLLSRKYILQSQKNNSRLLQSAFMHIAATVGDMLRQNRTGCMVNRSFTSAVDNFLWELEIPHSYCLCSRNPDKCCFTALNPVEEKFLYKIQTKLENLYNEKFDSPIYKEENGEHSYSFIALPLLDYDVAVEDRAFKDVNGDGNTVFTSDGRLYAMLSDGMGTGSRAAAESRTAMAMAKSLLSCGVTVHSMMNIVNLALNLRGSGEAGATLDVLTVDLYTGRAMLIKAGAGGSVVFNSKNFDRYEGESLPMGILKDVKYTTNEFKLTEGDTVVMATDGVGGISANVRNYFDKPCRQTAKFVIEQNKSLDDKTVLAIRFVKQG